uniref:Uncharacterized protein n=1 Tax=Opuntia streptacantha TaxID=393608 RepID=A0A7C9AML1_OPUST
MYNREDNTYLSSFISLSISSNCFVRIKLSSRASSSSLNRSAANIFTSSTESFSSRRPIVLLGSFSIDKSPFTAPETVLYFSVAAFFCILRFTSFLRLSSSSAMYSSSSPARRLI